MRADFDDHRADQLLSRLLHGEPDDGDMANALLAEFQQGYPIEELRRLLTSGKEEAVAVGVWIASELGAEARPLLDDIARLIDHPSSQVRFFTLDCLISCAGPEDEQAVNRALDLVEDLHRGVRWKALVFLATVSEGVLRTARHAVMTNWPTSSRARGLDLLLDAVASRDVATITAGLEDSDSVLQRYAAAAATRLAYCNPSVLRHAMASSDETVRQFATDMAQRFGILSSS